MRRSEKSRLHGGSLKRIAVGVQIGCLLPFHMLGAGESMTLCRRLVPPPEVITVASCTCTPASIARYNGHLSLALDFRSHISSDMNCGISTAAEMSA